MIFRVDNFELGDFINMPAYWQEIFENDIHTANILAL